MFSRTRLILLISLVVIPASQAIAGVSIRSPKPSDVWTAGKKTKVEFSAPRGALNPRIKIYPQADGKKPYIEHEVVVEGADPYRFEIVVPKIAAGPGGSETVIVEIFLTQDDGTTTFDQIKIEIKNPPAEPKR